MLTQGNNTIDESKLKQIAAGGEGVIYEYGKKVLKVYHTPRPTKFENHLKSLGNLDKRFVKPQQIWYTNTGLVGGFEMDYVDFNKYLLFNNLFNKGFCTTNGIDKKLKIKILESLKDAIELAHSQDIIIGDLNQYNLFVRKDGTILFCDVDSFETSHQAHSGMLMREIQDWTTTGISKQTDIFAYNILSFWCTTHVHPFQWTIPKDPHPIPFEKRVRQGLSILSKIQGVKIPACYEVPDPVVVPQYEEIFKGRRYYVDFNGVQTTNLVVNKTVSSTSLNIRELFTNVKKVRSAGVQCVVLTDKGWVLLDTKYQGITTQIKIVDCDELFPGKTEFLYLKGDILYTSKGERVQQFNNYCYHYNDGALLIVDYDRNNQHVYNIDNQLVGVESKVIPVFAKSILFNGCPIQNFGKKKYLNIPINGTAVLFETQEGTKTALYGGNSYVVTEAVEKNKVKFTLFKASTYKLESGVELDYLPHFCTKEDVLFLSEDNFIGVYKDFTMISKLDVNSTRDSQLFTTNSGILMLENSSLYLLNTK